MYIHYVCIYVKIIVPNIHATIVTADRENQILIVSPTFTSQNMIRYFSFIYARHGRMYNLLNIYAIIVKL